jgi:hypothetical protein
VRIPLFSSLVSALARRTSIIRLATVYCENKLCSFFVYPQELLEETERFVSELEEYVRRINRTNLSAMLSGGETTLTDALARRDALTLRYGNLKTLVSAASDRVPRYGRAEIRILSAVEVGPLRRRMDELARERRELDTAIQQATQHP